MSVSKERLYALIERTKSIINSGTPRQLSGTIAPILGELKKAANHVSDSALYASNNQHGHAQDAMEEAQKAFKHAEEFAFEMESKTRSELFDRFNAVVDEIDLLVNKAAEEGNLDALLKMANALRRLYTATGFIRSETYYKPHAPKESEDYGARAKRLINGAKEEAQKL